MSVDVMAVASGRGDAPALVTPTRWWTYDQLDSAVAERARGLRAEGVVPGRIVAQVVESDSEGILSLLALWRVGAVPAPLSIHRCINKLPAAHVLKFEGRNVTLKRYWSLEFRQDRRVDLLEATSARPGRRSPRE